MDELNILESQEEDDGILEMSTGTQVGIAAFFVGAPALAGLAELLHLGFAGLAVGAVGAGAIGIVGKQLLDKEKANGLPQLPVLERLRNVNWGATLDPEGVDATPSAQNTPLTPKREALEEMFDLGKGLAPHPDLVLSNRLAILGMPNAGKSNTVAVFAEELGDLGVPLVIFDQKPEYGRIAAKPYFVNPEKAGAHNVTKDDAYAFGQRVMNERLQVVVDLPSYEDDDVAAEVMIEIVKGIWAWEYALPNAKRIPCMFIVDEADYWLPQSEQHAHVNRTIKDDKGRSLFVRLQSTFFNVIHRGRSLGLGIVVVSQRPANLDNRAFAVAEWKILLKANMPHDLAVYRRFGVTDETAMNLARGQAFIIGPNEIKGVFQLRKRQSPDDSQTPGLRNLRQSSKAVETPVPPDVSGVSIFENVETLVETLLETASQVEAAKIIKDVFPASRETEETPAVSAEALVSADLMEAIKAMKEAGYPDREIAKLTKLSGRNYGKYQRVLRQLGYREEA